MREMRESGLGYLGEIPANWNVERLKNHLRFSPDKNPGDATILSLYREHGIVPKDSREDNHNVTSEDTSNYRHVRVGDLVVNKMKAWQGSMGVSDYEGVVSPAYYVYRFTTDAFDKRYLHYLLRSKCYADEFRRLSGGIRIGQWDLPKTGFETICVAVPPKTEQTEIAETIDAQSNKVDALIANVQAQIEKLKTYKQSMIAEVVTKGLDPTTPMKDSGIEWIGEIPAHWQATMFGKFVKSIQTGPFGSQLHSEDYTSDGVPVINPANIQNGQIVVDHKNSISGKKLLDLSQHLSIKGDILFGRRGEMGRCAVVGDEMTVLCGTGCIKIRCKESLLPSYAILLLQTRGIRNYLDLNAVGTTMKNLNTSIILRIPFVVPHFEEQVCIVRFVEERTIIIDKLIAAKQSKIEKLEQYKRSLIYEYVTGKKEVS